MAWLGFAPAGLAVLAFSALLHAQLTSHGGEGTSAVLLSLLGVSYVGAALFPCDAGAPFWGTWKNQMHNLVAGLGYFGAGAGLLEMKRAFEDLPALSALGPVSGFLGPVILLGMFALSFESPVRGLIQRTVEGVIFAWMVVVGAWLMAA
ncbi:putative membrane protein [Myxococcus hansupus]|uniref:Putative membrane protein n=1 Tax=Pseudomyxococcus hansupus TaxID=1297742 RepID=A0A0H4WVI0_9BACT|nr:putative membrane protein [Myxococcus hansupus]